MSSINPVSRSMNGIKTIETTSLIFTDDNSSLNTSAGIVSAQANSTTALNGKINSVGFNTTDGVLTLTKEDGSTLTKNLDGRYLASLDADDIPTLPASKITSGSFATNRIPDLDADKITTGTLGTNRIPDLDADKITTGTIDAERIPDLPYVSVGTSQTGRQVLGSRGDRWRVLWRLLQADGVSGSPTCSLAPERRAHRSKRIRG